MRRIRLEEVPPQLVDTVQAEYDALFSQDPQNYQTHLGDYEPESHAKTDLAPDADEQLYLIRDRQRNLLGYLKGCCEPPEEETPDAPVFREYTRQGESFTINHMEIFGKYRNQGLGSEVLDRIKRQGYELIDLTARESAEGFYRKNGFEDTTLRDEGRKVLAWHNPTYERREASLLEQQPF